MKNNINILYINTSISEIIDISLYINSEIISKSKKIIKGNMSNELLRFVNILLEEKKASFNSIDAITVFCGPGSYTSLRIGINTANTLAWVLNIPIICIKNKQEFQKEINNIKKKLKLKKYFSEQVDAYYQQAL